MSQLADIRLAQDNLEECFSKRMAELEAQLVPGGAAKDTVAKVAEEFRTFRELIFSMLNLLRQQITECSAAVDEIETRHRRKALVFLGVAELDKEDCTASITDIIRNRLLLSNFTSANITSCHRLGVRGKDHHRPILVRFSDINLKAAVWRSKSKLKGSPIAMREFLTRTRQSVFIKARQHFGMRGCWTQDGVVVIRTHDGSRHKVTSMDQLKTLTSKHPKISNTPSSSVMGSCVPGAAAQSITISKQRK